MDRGRLVEQIVAQKLHGSEFMCWDFARNANRRKNWVLGTPTECFFFKKEGFCNSFTTF